MKSLSPSIEALYAAFRGYRLRPSIPGCPHCDLEATESALHQRPLRSLSWDDLGTFLFKAMTTFGEACDFKHFLPRILELHALDPRRAHYGPELVIGKLDYARWRGWPAAETAAVEGFLDTWRATLERSESGED